MSIFNFESKSHDMTVDIGASLAKHLKPSDIVCLFGDLGSGKTTLVKGLAKGLGINSRKVSSPTFVLMNVYEGKKMPLYHFDFYRIEDLDDFMSIGCEEFLYGEGISVVEWAERFGNMMPKEYLCIQLLHKGDNERTLKFSAKGDRYKNLIKKIA